MNIGFFGGTFDPIHRGHLALARAARDHCKLSRTLFVPAGIPPHKQTQPLSAYGHRFAMIALATAQEKDFIPSLLEAPQDSLAIEPAEPKAKKKVAADRPNYTIDSLRLLKKSFKKADRLFLLIGIDAFKEIAKWHQADDLFRECEFIVASRPGFSLADVARALPEKLRPKEEVTRPFHKQAATGDLVLSGVTIHLLDGVSQPISSTAIRQAAAAAKPLARFLDPAVADYIKKTGMYKSNSPQECFG